MTPERASLAVYESEQIVALHHEELRTRTAEKIAELVSKLHCTEEHNHRVTIFDMDGTLYPHDGNQNGYAGSRSEQALRESHTRFILSREPSLSRDEASQVLQEAFTCGLGTSVFLASRYDCTREDIFAETWNTLSIEGIVESPQLHSVASILVEARKKACATVLLTAAPALWKEKVLRHLNVPESMFDTVITTEDFNQKSDVFEALAALEPRIRAISIGDKHDSDIAPAQEVGFKTIHMTDAVHFADIPSMVEKLYE